MVVETLLLEGYLLMRSSKTLNSVDGIYVYTYNRTVHGLSWARGVEIREVFREKDCFWNLLLIGVYENFGDEGETSYPIGILQNSYSIVVLVVKDILDVVGNILIYKI